MTARNRSPRRHIFLQQIFSIGTARHHLRGAQQALILTIARRCWFQLCPFVLTLPSECRGHDNRTPSAEKTASNSSRHSQHFALRRPSSRPAQDSSDKFAISARQSSGKVPLLTV
jgi:hypothetical protein